MSYPKGNIIYARTLHSRPSTDGKAWPRFEAGKFSRRPVRPLADHEKRVCRTHLQTAEGRISKPVLWISDPRMNSILDSRNTLWVEKTKTKRKVSLGIPQWRFILPRGSAGIRFMRQYLSCSLDALVWVEHSTRRAMSFPLRNTCDPHQRLGQGASTPHLRIMH
jgi:hypothetical protein